MRTRRWSSEPTALERELALLERRLMAELRRELDRQVLELRRDLYAELESVNERIDGVLTRSLRALNTKREEGRQ